MRYFFQTNNDEKCAQYSTKKISSVHTKKSLLNRPWLLLQEVRCRYSFFIIFQFLPGYGEEKHTYSQIYKIGIVVWIMIALSYWVMLLNFLQKALKRKYVPKRIRVQFKAKQLAKQAEFLRQLMSKVIIYKLKLIMYLIAFFVIIIVIYWKLWTMKLLSPTSFDKIASI